MTMSAAAKILNHLLPTSLGQPVYFFYYTCEVENECRLRLSKVFTMIRGRIMGEFFGREKWNSKTQIWGQSEGIHNPGHDFPRLWTKRISLRWLHICWKVDENVFSLFPISWFSFYRALPSPPLCHRIWSWWRIVSVSNQLNFWRFQVLEYQMVWGSDYFPRVISPHWAERSIGAHLLFVVIKSVVIFQFQMFLNWMINTAIH